MQEPQPIRNLAVWLGVFFLVVLGAKLWTIQIWGTNIPYWDQWDEARLLFQPWLDGTWSWRDFFIPHNEHRIVLTRLLDLLEIKWNGQWDPFFQMVVNALLHAGYGGLLVLVLWRGAGRKHAGLICVALIPFFALPFVAENTTRGFQSQMYLLNIFSVAAMLGLGFGRPGGGLWFCGLGSAVLAIFTMASGFLAAVALVGLVMLRGLNQRSLPRAQIPTLLVGALLVALGLALKTDVPGHQGLRAHSLNRFFATWNSNLAWPFEQPGMALVMCLPLGLLAVKYCQSNRDPQRSAEFVLTFGLWGLLQEAVLAFGRAQMADSSRYLDTLSTLPMASLAALFVLAADFNFRPFPKPPAPALAVLWSVILLAGLAEDTRSMTEAYLIPSRSLGVVETENVRAFIATEDTGWMQNQPRMALPYPDGDVLVDLLRQPALLAIMPGEARQPLSLKPNHAFSSGFFTNGFPPAYPGRPLVRVWGNCMTNGTSVAGRLISDLMTARLPELSLQIYSDSGSTDAKIQLIETNGRVTTIYPRFSNRWQNVIVAAPQRPFVLSMAATAGEAVAVGEIKELGRFSKWAHDLIDHARLILFLGLGMAMILAVMATARPGLSLTNDGLAWLLALVVIVTALSAAVCWRNHDADEYTVSLDKKWAATFRADGQPARAELYQREAQWLRP